MAKYMTPEEFIKETNGKSYDVDHAYGVQCVDGIAEFTVLTSGSHNFSCGSKKYAYGLWTDYGKNGVEKYFIQLPFSEARLGDWIVWNWGSKSAPKSHVGMFYKNVSKNVVNTYGQNAGKGFHFENAYTDGILGVLRPRIYLSQLKYRGHIQSTGWTDWKYSGEICGTTGQQKRLEAIQIDFGDKIVEAKAHIQKDGWVDYGKINKDTIIGTTGEAKRLECLQLKGDFEFQIHIQSYGWSCFTDADGICTLGSVGQQKRIEAIVIKEK